MKKTTALVVLGNRPQFIKHAALHRAIAQRSDEISATIVDTGQHYDYALNGIFLDELQIPAPDHALGIGSASHAEQLARMLPDLEEIMIRSRPDWVVLYGDTNSTLGGALAASKLTIPIAHIEAGLRSFDRRMPEEINRVMTDHVSELLLCPTRVSVANLRAEGIAAGVHDVGDVMVDIAHGVADRADERWETLQRQLGLPQAGSFGLVTAHRASNTEPNALHDLIELLRAVEIPLVLPLHPRTQAALERSGMHVALSEIPGLTILPPLGYVDLASVVRKAQVVLTDSGGLQKEAYAHGIPCITLRENTEWTETVELGWNTIVGLNASRARAAVQAYIASPPQRPSAAEAPYGSGNAADQIVELLLDPHARARETA